MADKLYIFAEKDFLTVLLTKNHWIVKDDLLKIKEMKRKRLFTWFEMHEIAVRQNVKKCSEEVDNFIWFIVFHNVCNVM